MPLPAWATPRDLRLVRQLEALSPEELDAWAERVAILREALPTTTEAAEWMALDQMRGHNTMPQAGAPATRSAPSSRT